MCVCRSMAIQDKRNDCTANFSYVNLVDYFLHNTVLFVSHLWRSCRTALPPISDDSGDIGRETVFCNWLVVSAGIHLYLRVMRVPIYKWLNDWNDSGISKIVKYNIILFYISPLSADACKVPSRSPLHLHVAPPVRPPVPPACIGSAATQHSHSPPVLQEKLNPKSNQKWNQAKCQAVCKIKASPRPIYFFHTVVNPISAVAKAKGFSHSATGIKGMSVPCGTVNLTVKHWIAAACFCSAFQDFISPANDLCNASKHLQWMSKRTYVAKVKKNVNTQHATLNTSSTWPNMHALKFFCFLCNLPWEVVGP